MNRGRPGRRWIACFTLAALAFAALGAAAAFAHSANGGGSIATAPALPLDKTTASGWGAVYNVDNTYQPGEFWKLQMNAGDRLVFDVADTTGQDCGSQLWIYSPNVTDYTISQTDPVKMLGTGSTKYEYTWVAPSTGDWRLFVNDGCAPYSYTFSALLQLFTSTTLKAPPNVVALHERVKLAGSISSGGSGNLLLKVQGPHHFKLQKLLPIVGGKFRFLFKPKRTGRYYARASYSGDSHHRPSSSKRYTIRVVK